MPFTQVTDDWPDDPETLELDRSTRLLHIEALVWCNHWGRDGRLPRTAQSRVTDHPDVAAAIAELVAAGWWDVTADGWQLIKLQDDQMPAAEVRHRQALAKDRQRRNRKHKADDHSECDSRYCKRVSRDVSRVTDVVTHDSPVQSSPAQSTKTGNGLQLTPALPEQKCPVCGGEKWIDVTDTHAGHKCSACRGTGLPRRTA